MLFGKRLDALLVRHGIDIPEGARREWLELMRHLIQDSAESASRQGFKVDPSLYKPPFLPPREPVNLAPYLAQPVTPEEQLGDETKHPSHPTIIEASASRTHLESPMYAHSGTLAVLPPRTETLLQGEHAAPTGSHTAHGVAESSPGYDTNNTSTSNHHGDESGVPNDIDDAVSLRYEDLGMIAQGGMGEVRRVKDRELNRVMAMKVLREKWISHPEVMLRFMEEAQTTAQLQHPGVAPVHELGYLPDGRLYFTMQEIRGETLTARIRRLHRARLSGQQPYKAIEAAFTDLLEAFCYVCETVDWVHTRGVIHRDLKPENVMIGELGEVLVVDWGLARIKDRHDDLADLMPNQESIHTHRTRAEAAWDTHLGEVIGTPAYMPPEQAQGEHDKIGPAADIYALGAILYELLSGRPPYEGDSFARILYKVLEGPPPPPVPSAQETTAKKHETAHSAPPLPFVVPATPSNKYETPTEAIEAAKVAISPRHTPVAPLLANPPISEDALPSSLESLDAADQSQSGQHQLNDLSEQHTEIDTGNTTQWMPPSALRDICMRAMSRRPEERHENAMQLCRELRNWLAQREKRAQIHNHLEAARMYLSRFQRYTSPTQSTEAPEAYPQTPAPATKTHLDTEPKEAVDTEDIATGNTDEPLEAMADNAASDRTASQRREAMIAEAEAIECLQAVLLLAPKHREARHLLLKHAEQQLEIYRNKLAGSTTPADDIAVIRYERLLRNYDDA